VKLDMRSAHLPNHILSSDHPPPLRLHHAATRSSRPRFCRQEQREFAKSSIVAMNESALKPVGSNSPKESHDSLKVNTHHHNRGRPLNYSNLEDQTGWARPQGNRKVIPTSHIYLHQEREGVTL